MIDVRYMVAHIRTTEELENLEEYALDFMFDQKKENMDPGEKLIYQEELDNMIRREVANRNKGVHVRVIKQMINKETLIQESKENKPKLVQSKVSKGRQAGYSKGNIVNRKIKKNLSP